MPRTAVMLAQTHKGEWKLISPPSDNIVDQIKKFRDVRILPWDETFQRITFQESDGILQTHVLRSKEGQKAHEENIAKQLEISKQAKKRFEDSCKAASDEVGVASAARYQKNVDAENKRRAEAQKNVSTPKGVDLTNLSGLRTDGPTLSEYIAKGYKPENYPPQGYAVVPERETPVAAVPLVNKTSTAAPAAAVKTKYTQAAK